MSTFIIRVDSSVKSSPSGTKYGQATAGWSTYVEDLLEPTLISAGLIFLAKNGPNKMIYEGIFAALSQLESEYLHDGDIVKIYVDYEGIVNQLNGSPAVKMKKHKDIFLAFKRRYPKIKFKIFYENENKPDYKKVDQISKRGRDWILKILK